MRNQAEAKVLNLPKNCPSCGSEQIYDPRSGTPYCDDCGEEVTPVWAGKVYVKSAYQPMRPYVEGEDMTGIGIFDGNTPEVGGMIAYNPNNFKDMWYVSPVFFGENYSEVPKVDTWQERLLLEYRELGVKHNDLAQFLLTVENASTMSTIDWNLLCNQRDIMEAYIGILETRMTNLDIVVEDIT